MGDLTEVFEAAVWEASPGVEWSMSSRFVEVTRPSSDRFVRVWLDDGTAELEVFDCKLITYGRASVWPAECAARVALVILDAATEDARA